ncbi:Os11g0599100, partial [Oryza sativa Japonica Group]
MVTCNNKPNLTLKLCYDTVLPGKFVDDLYLMTSKNRTSGWSVQSLKRSSNCSQESFVCTELTSSESQRGYQNQEASDG